MPDYSICVLYVSLKTALYFVKGLLLFFQVGDETDELLLADDEMYDVDPETLPRRLLSDFSVYNSEVYQS